EVLRLAEKPSAELRLVITLMAPLLARLPYTAAALGPLSTLILAISSGLILEMPAAGTPSTMYSGWLFPLIDRSPRMTTRLSPPTPVPERVTERPATLPESELSTFSSRASDSSLELTSCTA